MSASEKAKAGGLRSLREMSNLVNVPVTTLNDWEKTRPVTFNALIFGAVEIKKRETDLAILKADTVTFK